MPLETRHNSDAGIRVGCPPEGGAFTQNLRVHVASTVWGQRIRYIPGELPNGDVPPEVFREVNEAAVRGSIDTVRKTVDQLAQLAVVRQTRGELGVEAEIASLAAQLLPDGGFRSLIHHGRGVEFDADDLAFATPWEMFEEEYGVCPDGHVVKADQAHCGNDGKPVSRIQARLGIGRTIGFVVRPTAPPPNPGGREALMLVDPLGDLLNDSLDPEGECRRNRDAIYQLLDRHFARVHLLSGSTAKSSAVLKLLRERDLATLYYFGHGDAQPTAEGSLRLYDRPLLASEIEKVQARVPLVFLNACWGGAINLDRHAPHGLRSVGHAFAQGPRKSVIASLWPLVGRQAMRAGLHFLTAFLEGGASVGTALREVRCESLNRYADGEPEISWMSYRLLGDPNTCLEAEPAQATSGVFGALGELRGDAFAFSLSGVLLRAAKRRFLQQRRRVSIEDLAAGLLRRGDLLRFLCERVGCDPDVFYDRLLRVDVGPDDPMPAEPETAADAQDDDPPAVMDVERWIIRSRDDFEPELAELLSRAWLDVNRGRSEPVPISERNLIEAFFRSTGPRAQWIHRLEAYWPPAGSVWSELDSSVGGDVDENGRLVLSRLDEVARRVVERAHDLAEARGAEPIPNRIMMAAFLSEPSGYATQTLSDLGVDTERLRTKLISSVEGKAPSTFALSWEACRKIVLPTLAKAELTLVAEGLDVVDEALLFRSFARVADRRLKDMLLRARPSIDLELAAERGPAPAPGVPDTETNAAPARQNGKGIDVAPDALDPSAREVLEVATHEARLQRSSVVQSPHLFLGLVQDGAGPAGRSLRERGIDLHHLRRLVLSLVRVRPAPDEALILSPHCADVFERAAERARGEGRSESSAQDLFAAFFTDDGGVVGELLRHGGIELGREEAEE